ncbi:MAG TPA: PAS domain S-box protein [Syntrophobacteraceae bacterium]|nr:PAS domain S-box protein [Syntrophobacteraceae bacterium]
MKFLKAWIIPAFLFGVCVFLLQSAYTEVKRKSIEQLNVEQRLLARQAAKGIESFFDHYLHLLQGLSRVDHVIAADEEGLRMMHLFLEAHGGDLQGIVRLDGSGKILRMLPSDTDLTDLSYREHVQTLLQTRQPVVSEVFASNPGGQSVAIHVPVYKDSRFDGSLGFLIPFDRLARKYLEDIRLMKDGYAWVISRSGIELFCPVPGHIGNSVFDNCKDFPSILDMAREMVKGKEGTTTYVFDKLRGESTEAVVKHAVYMPVRLHNTFWSIVVATPEHEILESIQGLRDRWLLIAGILGVSGVFWLFGFVRAYLLAHEVSRRRKTEADLLESEKRYRQLVELAQEGIWVTDVAGNTTFVNPRMAEMLGYSPEEMSGRPFCAFAAPSAVEDCRTYMEREQEGTRTQWELEFLRKDGTPVIGSLSTCSILDDQGNPVGSLALVADVTQHRRAEAGIRESRLQMMRILEGFPVPAFFIGKDHRVIYWNRAIEELTGIRSETVIGTNEHWRAFYAAERPCMADLLADETPEALSRLYEGKYGPWKLLEEAYEATDFFPALGSKGKWLHFTAVAIRDSQGALVGVIETLQDITERKRTEDALQESRQRLADIIDFLPDATFVVDREGRVIAWNRAMEEMTGVPASHMLGKGDFEYALPFYGERRPLLIDLVLKPDPAFESLYDPIDRSASVLSGEAYFPALRGSEAYLLGKASVLSDSKGNVVGAIESIRDITRRKKAEAALRIAEEKYRSIFENAIEGIYQTTLDGRFLSVNPAFAGMLGYDSPEELIGAMTDIRTQLYANPNHRTRLLREIEARGAVRDFEVRFLRKDGKPAWVSLNVHGVRDETGTIRHIEGSAQDITERRLLEARLAQAHRMEAIGTLAGGIAHDFNNMLSPILGYSELSLLEIPENTRLRHNIEQVIQAAYRARDLVKQILTFSRNTPGELKPVRPGMIIREALGLLRPSLPSTIEIHTNLDEDAVHSTVIADSTGIHQVLMNLCTNAAHAMRETGGVLTIGLDDVDLDADTARQHQDLKPGPYVRLSVSDTGHGMEDSVKERIFDPYFTTKGPSEGSGMGLAVVYGIVKSLSGGIEVFSRPGRGTTFEVYLPRSGTSPEPIRDSLPGILPGKGRILVVDDEKVLVEMIKEMLESLGYEVSVRYTSMGALEFFRDHSESFDAVITDQTMPHMTGIQLAREILKIRGDVPVILCTGFSEIIDEETAQHYGIKAFLMKPVAMQQLAEVVRTVLNRE